MEDFSKAYKYLEKMVNHDDRWILRAVGVAVHFYAREDTAPSRKFGNSSSCSLPRLTNATVTWSRAYGGD